LDVRPLRALYATAQQKHQASSIVGTVDPVARPRTDEPKFQDALTNVVEIAQGSAPDFIDAGDNLRDCNLILLSHPGNERLCAVRALVDFNFPWLRFHCVTDTATGQAVASWLQSKNITLVDWWQNSRGMCPLSAARQHHFATR